MNGERKVTERRESKDDHDIIFSLGVYSGSLMGEAEEEEEELRRFLQFLGISRT